MSFLADVIRLQAIGLRRRKLRVTIWLNLYLAKYARLNIVAAFDAARAAALSADFPVPFGRGFFNEAATVLSDSLSVVGASIDLLQGTVSVRIFRMAEYRAFTVGEDGNRAVSHEMVCREDGEAVARAKRLIDGHDIEVWSGDRLVIRLTRNSK